MDAMYNIYWEQIRQKYHQNIFTWYFLQFYHLGLVHLKTGHFEGKKI